MLRILSYTSLFIMLAYVLSTSLHAEEGTEQLEATQQTHTQTQAQNAEEAKEDLRTKINEDMQNANKARRKAAEKASAIMKEITKDARPPEKHHMTLVYSNYNFIQTVRVVQKDVGNAIQKCSENNPEMKDGLEDRFAQWNEEVNPLLEEADANLQNMILAQEYAPEEKFDEIFAAVDEARHFTTKHIQKIPVTTPEACTYLKNKMDETQDIMATLLQNTLISYPRSFIDDHTIEEEEAEPAGTSQDNEA